MLHLTNIPKSQKKLIQLNNEQLIGTEVSSALCTVASTVSNVLTEKFSNNVSTESDIFLK